MISIMHDSRLPYPVFKCYIAEPFDNWMAVITGEWKSIRHKNHCNKSNFNVISSVHVF